MAWTRRRVLATLVAACGGAAAGRARAGSAAGAGAGAGNGEETPSMGERGEMLTRPIPRTGEALPVIGLGTWQTFDVRLDEAARGRLGGILRRFHDAGGRVVDSSPMYGRSEEVVGELSAASGINETLFLASKVWTTGRAEGLAQAEQSLARMRRRRLDLLQVHNLVDLRTQLATLRAMKQEGRVRYVGVTHYTTGSLPELARLVRGEALDFVQLPYSLGVRDAERELLPACADSGTAVLVNRPFEEGALFRRVKGRPLPDFAAEIGAAGWGAFFLKFLGRRGKVVRRPRL